MTHLSLSLANSKEAEPEAPVRLHCPLPIRNEDRQQIRLQGRQHTVSSTSRRNFFKIKEEEKFLNNKERWPAAAAASSSFFRLALSDIQHRLKLTMGRPLLTFSFVLLLKKKNVKKERKKENWLPIHLVLSLVCTHVRYGEKKKHFHSKEKEDYFTTTK